MEDRTPDAVDAGTFKAALRRWCSGVTVVTSAGGAGPHGMTVSAFSSVSASPPLVLVCCNRTSNSYGVMVESGIFGVNVLAAGQEALSARFSDAKLVDRFAGIDWSPGARTGAPLLAGAAMQLECRTRRTHDEGTHAIFIGEVVAADSADVQPLLYHDGAYARLR
ncbi:MAG: flavin reductase family protein [Myxococcota bacterium]